MFLLFILLALASEISAQNKLVCYYGSWASYRSGIGNLDPSNIDVNLCTHIVYAFLGVNGNTISFLDNNFETFNRFVALKSKNPNLKLIVAVGGWNYGSTYFSPLAANPTARKEFAQNALAFLNQNKLDGLDIDWEYPTANNGNPADQQNFKLLLSDLSQVLRPKYTLSIAVAAGSGAAGQYYGNIAEIPQYVDSVHLMAYDFQGSWNQFTGLHTALYSVSGDPTPGSDIDSSVKYWSQWVPNSKLIVGMATYGKTFNLRDPNNNGIFAPTIGPGTAGQWTQEAGTLSYYEICYNNYNIKAVYNEQRGGAYASIGSNWVGFDDINSIAQKATYVLNKGLGGAMFWSLENDDMTGTACNQGKYPLISTVARILNRNPSPPNPQPDPQPVPTTAQPDPPNPQPDPQPVPPNPQPSPKCDATFYRDPNDCSAFHQCVNGIIYDFKCGAGTYFDPAISVCNWNYLVRCP